MRLQVTAAQSVHLPLWRAPRGALLVALSSSLAPQQLTARLRDAPALPTLVTLHRLHNATFDDYHVGAFWGGVKRLAPKQRRWLRENREMMRPACLQTATMLREGLDARSVRTHTHTHTRFVLGTFRNPT